MADRNANTDARQRRAFQQLEARIAALEATAGSGSGPGSGDDVWNESPAGTIDGTNDSFTLADAPTAASLMLFRNGVLLKQGGAFDYVLTGTTITFVTDEQPQAGDLLTAFYRKA